MSRNQPKLGEWEADGDIQVAYDQLMSFGAVMPYARHELIGWRHFLTTTRLWYTFNDSIVVSPGLWDSEQDTVVTFWSATTVAAGANLGGALVPAGMAGILYDSPSLTTRVVEARGRQNAGSTTTVHLRVAGTNATDSELVFDGGTAASTTPTTIVSVLGLRALQARNSVGTYQGGFCQWRLRHYQTSTP